MDKRWVIAKMGTTLAEIKQKRGDFERWIAKGCDVDLSRFEIVECQLGQVLPKPEQTSALIMTGSSSMVSEREEWSEAVAGRLPEYVKANVPILGICYGHQLLAHALGGTVHKNPNGREIGTIQVEQTKAASNDALVSSLPNTYWVHATHAESVIELPAGAVLLGSNDLDPHQVFRVGETAWGVQFHPEFDHDIITEYVNGRSERIKAEGLDLDAIYSGIRPSDSGSAILRNFAKIVTRHAE